MQGNLREFLKKDSTRIKWVNSGTANSFTYTYKDKKFKVIELNKDLIDYPKLFMPILLHELRHTKDFYNRKDLANDLRQTVPKIEFFKFMLSHPSSFKELSPAYYEHKKGWVIDINVAGFWLLGAFMLGLLLYFFRK